MWFVDPIYVCYVAIRALADGLPPREAALKPPNISAVRLPFHRDTIWASRYHVGDPSDDPK